MHALFSRVFALLKFASQLEYAFFVRGFGCAFFCFVGHFMTDIEVIRELHCYMKMYSLMLKTVSGCVDTCRDLVVREKLIKAMQEAEDIYTGEIYEYKILNADERIIIALLKLLMDTEIDRVTNPDMELIDYCVEWSLAIQNKKVELSEEFINERIKKIFYHEKEETDSEQ